MEEFVSLLRGTYALTTRTINGVLINAEAKYYLDVAAINDSEATGTALLLDRGNLGTMDPNGKCEECQEAAAMGALWDVRVQRGKDGEVTLIMDGEYVGSYGEFRKGVKAVEKMTFIRQGGRYLSGHLVSPAGGDGNPDDVWDRIELNGQEFTYVSCKNRYFDKYTKLSSDKPTVDGQSLAATWAQKKSDRSLLEPRAVPKRFD